MIHGEEGRVGRRAFQLSKEKEGRSIRVGRTGVFLTRILWRWEFLGGVGEES